MNRIERYRGSWARGLMGVGFACAFVTLIFWSGWAVRGAHVRSHPHLLRVDGLDPRWSILVPLPPDSSLTLRWDGHELKRVR